MKKILCLLLVSVLLFSLCGCFGSDKDVRGEVTSATQSQEVTEFSFGKTASNTYKNDFLGLSCTLPEEWSFATDEEILELNSITKDALDEDLTEVLENADLIYDMNASTAEGSNVNVNLQKLSLAQVATLDIKKELESQIDMIKSSYESMGFTKTEAVYEKVKVDGKDVDALKITANIQDYSFYGVSFSFRKGNYLATATVGAMGTDKTAEYLGYFKFN